MGLRGLGFRATKGGTYMGYIRVCRDGKSNEKERGQRNGNCDLIGGYRGLQLRVYRLYSLVVREI